MNINIKQFRQIFSKFDNYADYILPVIFAVLSLILVIQFTYIFFFDENFNSNSNSNNINNLNNNIRNNQSNNHNDFLLKNQLPLQLCPQVVVNENINKENNSDNLKCEPILENNITDDNDDKNNKNNIIDSNKKVFTPTITKHNKNSNLPSFTDDNKQLSTAETHFINAEKFVSNNDWKNAQQEFFNAYHKQPNNPVYAYNLAISLEQLNQTNFAINYYEKTLELITKNQQQHTLNTLFDKEKIQNIKQHLLLLQQTQQLQQQNEILE